VLNVLEQRRMLVAKGCGGRGTAAGATFFGGPGLAAKEKEEAHPDILPIPFR
jgi:hypothetical protein